MRVYLLHRVPKDGQEWDLNRELRYYRATGLFLFGLDLALSGVATQIVRDGYGSNYPGMLIYVAAMHTFYSLTLAIVNTVKYRKFRSPVLSAAKAVSLTTALVSMFNLQTAMIDQFGEGDEQFRLIMTACTAFAVCVTVLAVPGFIGWALPYFLYQKLAAKRAKVVAELVERKYDEIYEICEQGNKLLN